MSKPRSNPYELETDASSRSEVRVRSRLVSGFTTFARAQREFLSTRPGKGHTFPSSFIAFPIMEASLHMNRESGAKSRQAFIFSMSLQECRSMNILNTDMRGDWSSILKRKDISTVMKLQTT